MLGRRRLACSGVTLVEVVVGMTIVAILAAVLVPQVIGRLSGGQAAALVTNIDALREAILAFRGDTGRYPQRLSLLATPIVASSEDTCGAPIPSPGSWKGPYLDRAITPAAGIPVGSAIIADSLRRSPAAATSTNLVGTLTIAVAHVDEAVASQIEASVDGNGNLGAGTIRWSATGGGLGELRYDLVIRGC